VAYKTFVAGEEALAADVNTYLMGQTVARFASAAARTSGLPAPVLNQLSMLDTAPGVLDTWNGAAWTRVASNGVSTAYTPAWIPGGNLGSGGSISGRYSMISPFTMYLRFRLVLGTAPSLTAGTIAVGLPAGYNAQTAFDQYGAGILSYFGRGAYPLQLVNGSGDAGRILLQVPRGATPGTSDGSIATILDPVTTATPTGWAVAGSFLQGAILLEVDQRW
jgi:hypothetical protein